MAERGLDLKGISTIKHGVTSGKSEKKSHRTAELEGTLEMT